MRKKCFPIYTVPIPAHQRAAVENLARLVTNGDELEQCATSDLYRVNFEVNNLKPFACLAFPHTTYLKAPRKQPIFGDELVTSFLLVNLYNPHFLQERFRHMTRTRNKRG